MASNNNIFSHIDRKSRQHHATTMDILNSQPHAQLMQSQFPEPISRKSSYSSVSTNVSQYEDPQEVPNDSVTYLKIQEHNRNHNDWHISPCSSLDLGSNQHDHDEKINMNMNVSIMNNVDNDSGHSNHSGYSGHSIQSSMSATTESFDVNSSYVQHQQISWNCNICPCSLLAFHFCFYLVCPTEID